MFNGVVVTVVHDGQVVGQTTVTSAEFLDDLLFTPDMAHHGILGATLEHWAQKGYVGYGVDGDLWLIKARRNEGVH